MKRVAIIGGGWAGIAAAVYLTQKKYAVSLFEAGRALGGRAKSLVSLENTTAPVWSSDNGQHLILGAYRESFRLMKILGVSPQKQLKELDFQIETPHLFFEGKKSGWHAFLPFFFKKHLQNLSFLKNAQGLTALEKKEALRFLFSLRKAKIFESNLESWLNAYFQPNSLFLNEFLLPLSTAALNTPPQNASALVFQSVLRDSLISLSPQALRFFIPQNGLSSLLPQPATKWLTQHGAQLFLSTRILKLEKTQANTWLLHSQNGAMHVDFDLILLSTMPDAARNLLESAGISFIPPLDFEPVATLYARFEKVHSLKGLHYFDSPFPAWVIPQDEKGVAIVLSATGEWEREWSFSTEKLTQQFKNSIEKRQNQKLGGVLFEKAVQVKKAAFSVRPFLNRPEAGRTPFPGLYLAGDYTIPHYPSTLESAVLSGKIAAQHIKEDFPR